MKTKGGLLLRAASEGLGSQSGKDVRGSLVWLSMALLPMSKRASPTLCSFRESSSSQAAPLPDRVNGRAAVLGYGGWGAENC